MDDSEASTTLRLSVLILASTYPRWEGDSVPVFVAQYAAQLKAEGLSVTVLAPHHVGASRDEMVGGVRVRRFRYWWPASGQDIAYGQYGRARLGVVKGAAYTVAQAAACLRLARSHDVVNAHWLIPQGFAAAVATLVVRRPLVVTVHGGDVFTLKGRFATALKRWTLGRAAEVVVNSTATRRMCEGIRARPYRTIPMGVPDRFQVRGGIDPKPTFRLLFVGRLADGKGVLDAIDALALVSADGVKAHLTIAGDGPERAAARARASERGAADLITFSGWVSPESLPLLYARADVLLAPSTTTASGWREAFGLVLVEAALAGIPAIGTRSGGIPDVIVDGETGLLVDEHSPRQIADAMRRLSEDAAWRTSMGAAARRRAGERFTWAAVTPRHVEALRSAMRPRGVSTPTP